MNLREAEGRPDCPVHKLPCLVATDQNAGEPFDFWLCPDERELDHPVFTKEAVVWH